LSPVRYDDAAAEQRQGDQGDQGDQGGVTGANHRGFPQQTAQAEPLSLNRV
jgi:hypothetical protein